MKIDIKTITTELVVEQFVKDLKVAFPVADGNPDWNLEQTKKLVGNSSNKLFVGYIDGQIVSFIYGYTLDRFDNKKEFYIHELGTKPSFRRQGVMTAMTKYFFENLKNDGYNAVWVLTDPDNKAAINLYNKTIGTGKPQIMFEKDF